MAARELRDVPSLRSYRLRESGLTALIRHPLLDIWVLEEIFRFGIYEPPPGAARALARLDGPVRILDLGGNVGLFALFALGRFPNSRVVSFEPDPDNAGVLAGAIEANGLQASWRLIEACAATRDGDVDFASSYHLSRVAPPHDAALAAKQQRIASSLPFLADSPMLTAEHRRVHGVDVFPFLADADLVKIDIEGAEWDILGDPRVGELKAAVVVLEYHPVYGPGEAGPELVRRTFETAGYVLSPPVPSDDAAVVWAWREPRNS